MNLKYIVLIVAVISTAGCELLVSSVHPLYSKSVLISDDRILGEWVPYDAAFKRFSKNASWKIEKSDREKTYKLLWDFDGKSMRYNFHLVRLGESVYADLILENDGDLATLVSSLRIHQFFRLIVEPDAIRLKSGIQAGHFAAAAEKHGLPLTRVDGRVLLTASTRQLQQFIREQGSQVFKGTDTILKRRN